jgi:hypothetical protein
MSVATMPSTEASPPSGCDDASLPSGLGDASGGITVPLSGGKRMM